MPLIQGDSESCSDIEPQERARIEEGHRRLVAAAGSAVVTGHELARASTATTLEIRVLH